MDRYNSESGQAGGTSCQKISKITTSRWQFGNTMVSDTSQRSLCIILMQISSQKNHSLSGSSLKTSSKDARPAPKNGSSLRQWTLGSALTDSGLIMDVVR